MLDKVSDTIEFINLMEKAGASRVILHMKRLHKTLQED